MSLNKIVNVSHNQSIFYAIGKRNNISDLYINWPTGGVLFPKLGFVYISNPDNDFQCTMGMKGIRIQNDFF